MLLIYTHPITCRVQYTFNLIFKTILGIDFEITSDLEKFKQHNGAKISYTKNPIADEIFFSSEDLLFETEVKNVSQLPIDKFVLSFFLATRYEEYLSFEADKYGRFSAK